MTKYCSTCGSEINDEENFCSNCGNKLAIDIIENYTADNTDQSYLLKCENVNGNIITFGTLYAYQDRIEFITKKGVINKYLFSDMKNVYLSKFKTLNFTMKNNKVIIFSCSKEKKFAEWIKLANANNVELNTNTNLKHNKQIVKSIKIIAIIVVFIVIASNLFKSDKDKAYDYFEKYKIENTLTIKDVFNSKYFKDTRYEILESDKERYCIIWYGKLKSTNESVDIKSYYSKDNNNIAIEHISINKKYYKTADAAKYVMK